MKELSIEEKAKRYDEAIEVARKYWNSPRTCIDIDVLPELFPEIRELDDEEIRNGIIQYLEQSQFGEDHYQIDDDIVRDYIAWLEKQGELIDIPADAVLDSNKDGLIADTIRYKREKQGEQNLVNTDLDELVIQLEETIGTSPHSRETIKDFFQKAVQKYMRCLQIANGEIGRLMDENYYLKEQKPAWSEEDDKMLDTVIKDIVTLAGPYVCYRTDVDWLKSLKDRVLPQPKQEWSEEDRRIFSNINLYIRKAGDYPHFNKENIKEAINWLKSLRPQSTWKPSIAQLNALSIVSKGNAPDDIEAIVSLYNDLKKL